ncbi:hypothetical protein DMN91_004569 [Ooceraea biroi]|uniref:Retrovirus-related Pol polyprotein from transposon TNT 1-94-like beta-barrel domain-containing protein n=1 Tax=Ooceraea biroi TaxID=2015173 RepID=A0A3L8DPK1_OOCBI|nr:hypothetical protein DMN91_004569 [Ooceraea biroi]
MVGALLLSGLPEYKPKIMGLENSGLAITEDTLKIKLLQEDVLRTFLVLLCYLGGWYLDSYATSHMSQRSDWMSNKETYEASVLTANNEKVEVLGKGSIAIKNGTDTEVIKVEDVLTAILCDPGTWYEIKMANTSGLHEKLEGRENFASWKFAMQTLLESEDLWDLREIGIDISEEMVGALLLSGLPEYKPKIMGLENSGLAITEDTLKIKLLQEVKMVNEIKEEAEKTAMYSKAKQFENRNKVNVTFSCGKPGHFAAKCRIKDN